MFALNGCFDVKLMLSVLPEYSNTPFVVFIANRTCFIKKKNVFVFRLETINIGRVKNIFLMTSLEKGSFRPRGALDRGGF